VGPGRGEGSLNRKFRHRRFGRELPARTECGGFERRSSGVHLTLVDGDLLDQDVEVIVNAWNRNLFPWWLLLPQGVSAAIKKRAGVAPFRELRRHGVLPLGAAVLTTAGSSAFRGIIHVAGIGFSWQASERSIDLCVRNALTLARATPFRSIAFPLIGAGTGGKPAALVQRWMLRALGSSEFDGFVRLVRYRAAGTESSSI
jgi:O-acetyl-ADP-ribose deacetylase